MNETDDPPLRSTPPSPEQPDLFDDDDSLNLSSHPVGKIAISPRLALVAGKAEKKLPNPVVGESKAAPPADPVHAAIAMRADGDLPGAIRFLYGQLAENLGDPRVYTTLATMLSENEEFDRAERIFQRAFAAGLDDPMLRLNYATFLAASGRSGEQVAEFRSVGAKLTAILAATPRADPSWQHRDLFRQWAAAECNLARLRWAEGNCEAARDLAEKWLTFEGMWISAHEIVEGCIGEGEELSEFAKLHEAHRASPMMVAALVDDAAHADPAHAIAIAAEATRYLQWNWIVKVHGFAEDLGRTMAGLRTRNDAKVQGDLVTLRALLS